jgi:hypothetical protein
VTNALRGAIIALVNAIGTLLIAFHVALTTDQLAALGTVANCALLVWMLARHAKV